jgi:NAD(P)H-dependent FMN reductase
MSKTGKNVKIVAILGSIRQDNMTSRVLAVVLDELKHCKGIEVQLIDPAKIQLKGGGEKSRGPAAKLQKIVLSAAGIILATPEYHGSYSSTIKLVIDNLGYPSVLAGKPVALLGVASGQIGAIKALEHLRSVCAHVGAIVLPQVVSIAGVHKLFDDQGRCTDAKIEERIRSLAQSLMEYIQQHVCPLAAFEETVREN